jgi:hypothetical protein
MYHRPEAPTRSGILEDSMSLVVLRPDGEHLDLGRFFLGEIEVQSDGGSLNFGSPENPRWFSTAVGDDNFFYTTSHRFEIREYSRAGTLRRVIRRSEEASPERSPPAIGGLVIDSQQNLWVQHYRESDEEDQRWSIFDTHGRPCAYIILPANLRLLQASEEFVLAVALDDLDVERVVLYGITRPS